MTNWYDNYPDAPPTRNWWDQYDADPARSKAVGGTAASPDAAAKSIDLSKQTNTPFELVNTDPTAAAEQLRTRQASEAADHPAISKYINSYPPAAEVSNDDYLNLIKTADTIRAFSIQDALARAPISILGVPISQGAAQAAVTGFQQGFKTGESLAFTPEEIAKYPLTYRTWQPFAAPIAALFRLPGGVIGATAAYLAETYAQLGGSRSWAARLERDAGIIGQGLLIEGGMKPAEIAPITREYARSGKLPGVGVDPVVDTVRGIQAHADAGILDEAVAQAQKSKTLARSPDAFEEFAKNASEQTISIPAEALAKIYESDPEKLSWIPGIEDKITVALETGGDVEIPLASYLAKGKDVHEAIRDDVRVRSGGLTVNEIKEIEAYHGSPHDFEAFSMEHIGKGEGAQSYGHGLYFAENKDVALSYVEKFAGSKEAQGTAEYFLRQHNGDRAAAIAELESFIASPRDVKNVPRMKEAVEVLRSDKRIEPSLYKIRIKADAENFLDWDKPLNEQNTYVQNALIQAMSPQAWEQFKQADASTAIRQGFIAFRDEEVARKLSEAGVPGIKYLDQGSRAQDMLRADIRSLKASIDELADHPDSPNMSKYQQMLAEKERQLANPTRNFVVFDDKLIQIIEKNGEPVQNATRAAADAEQSSLGLRTLFQNAEAAGMTEAQFNAYNKKVQGQVQAIEDRATSIAEREVKKRQTAEWKANEARERVEVEQEISQNPLHVADRELRADKRLGNVDPDILAPIFGFNSGEAMVRNLELLNNARNKAKQTPAQYLKDLISRETARRMESKYGDLQENIFNEARDLALADLHIDLMDTELRALTEQAKGEPPLSKDELRDWVRQNHGEADVKSGSQFDKFQRQAWKASREAEQALLKGNYIDAAKAKQRQLLSFMLAQEAQKLQKELRAADKLFSRFEPREVGNVDQAFTDRIHQILNMVEWPLKRDPAEIEAIAKKSLEDFVAEQEGNFREVPVAEFLLDGNFRGPLDTLSVDQFRAIHDSIKTLAHNGREIKTITTAAARAELEDVVGRAVDSLSRFNPVNQPLNKNPIQKTSAVARWILAEHMLPERILDITDKFDVHGPFNEFVDRPLRESLNKEFQITEEVTKRLRALRDDDANLYSRIENDLILDPYDKSGFMNLNRLNLRMIMLNMGNVGKKSNMVKLTEGFGVEESALRDFVNKHATKADWEWVNGMWDTFKYLKSEADQMYERLTGIASTSIKATSIDTPFGQYPGGYAPIIYDPMRARIGEARVRESLLEEPGYYRATTPNSYTKERTGATGALDISGVNLDRKIWQMAHDIAFREAIIGAGKVLTNGEVKAAITKFWGKEYADQFVPWLKDIANMRNSDDFPASTAAYWSSVIRQNVVSALVTINPGTITKHGLSAFGLSVAEVGPKNFLSALGDMTSTLGKADSQWQFVMDTSPFMRNRMQKYVESIRGAYAEATGKGIDITRPTTWRHPIMYYGRSPIMLFDSLSAVPTWIAAYKKAIEAGETTETATFAADKAVSRAHGSASVIDKPHVQRVDSEPMKWFTSLYNFFNHIFNKQVELVWDTKSAGAKLLRGEARTPNEAATSLTGRMVAHVIWPIVVEEWVTSWFDDTEQKRGLGQRISMAMIRHLGAGIVGLREVTHAWTSGGPKGPLHEPSTGMIGAVGKVVTQTTDDAIRKLKGKEPSKDWITHLGTSLGMMTGIGGAAPSKVIQFGQKVATGQESPQTPYQVLKGLRKGSMRERRHQ